MGFVPMRFVPYHQLDSTPNIIVDGAAGPGTVLTLSHWPKSHTPKELKRDTSAEIAFAYLDTPAMYVPAEIVSNNHFDEDGLLGMYALIDPHTAAAYRDLLIDVANAGDFGIYRQRDAARIAFTISAYADAESSPLPAEVFAMPYPEMAGRLYCEILEVLPKLLTDLGEYKSLWAAEDERLAISEELVEKGEARIEERPTVDLAVLHIPENLLPQRIHRFTQSREAEFHPYAVHRRTVRNRILTIQGQHIEFQYRYESWVQMATRRPAARVDLADFARELNEQETSGGHWVFDGVDRITPKLHLEGSPTTSVSPDWIQQRLEHHLSTGNPAWNPYD